MFIHCTLVVQPQDGINVVRWGLMFVDFVGHPYPRIYVSSNLYFINQTSKHRLLSFKTVFMNTGNTWRWHTKFLYFFLPSCENFGIIYFELFNCVNQHQSQTIFIKLRSLFSVQCAWKPLRWFHFPTITGRIEVFTRNITQFCNIIKDKKDNSFRSL